MDKGNWREKSSGPIYINKVKNLSFHIASPTQQLLRDKKDRQVFFLGGGCFVCLFSCYFPKILTTYVDVKADKSLVWSCTTILTSLHSL